MVKSVKRFFFWHWFFTSVISSHSVCVQWKNLFYSRLPGAWWQRSVQTKQCLMFIYTDGLIFPVFLQISLVHRNSNATNSRAVIWFVHSHLSDGDTHAGSGNVVRKWEFTFVYVSTRSLKVTRERKVYSIDTKRGHAVDSLQVLIWQSGTILSVDGREERGQHRRGVHILSRIPVFWPYHHIGDN